MKPKFVMAAASLSLAAAAAVLGLDSANRGSPAKTAAVKLEPIPGSPAKRVILTAKAAERLGIETSKVREEPIVRNLMVSGLVTFPVPLQPIAIQAGTGFAGVTPKGAVAAAWRPGAAQSSASRPTFAIPAVVRQFAVPAKSTVQLVTAPTAAAAPQPVSEQPDVGPGTASITGDAWVLVTVSPGEWDKLAKEKPARILPLATREGPVKEIVALPSGRPPVEDGKRSMLTLYYVVSEKDHGLMANTRVRVELRQSGSEEKRKVVPYGAVYYDAKGATWTYLNAEPLVFERRRIGVERIVGELAVLSDGPAVGTDVVVVGAPLLYGSEIFGK
jgi:hypothetical protein